MLKVLYYYSFVNLTKVFLSISYMLGIGDISGNQATKMLPSWNQQSDEANRQSGRTCESAFHSLYIIRHIFYVSLSQKLGCIIQLMVFYTSNC